MCQTLFSDGYYTGNAFMKTDKTIAIKLAEMGKNNIPGQVVPRDNFIDAAGVV